MDLFSRSWNALRAAVDELSEEDWERPSGCAGWSVRDLVCHLVIDAQDVLITHRGRTHRRRGDVLETGGAADRRGPARRPDSTARRRVR
ncbi:maleylpyruvate isomerase N-terminal domain-containing protein [Streptomyces sp. NPDC005925]|uniref:maleylpyruvate isomerase N-terminal domain-containing protein n=1 Tax=Streptomyces sp. NPDC005925 TaxID=3157172 RepID=UPI0033D371D2